MVIPNQGAVVEPYAPLDRTDLTERTYTVLKDRILTRQIAPGERVSVPVVAQALGVSRTPVTDALKRLAGEGLVEIQPRRGTFVTGLTARDVAELFDIRLLIELHAAEYVLACRLVPAFLKAVAEPMAGMRQAMKNDDYGDYATFIAGDHDLHLALVRQLCNQRLIQIYSDLNVHIQVARTHYIDSIENARQAYQEHEAILAGFEAGELEAVKEALRQHITNVKSRMVELLDALGGKL
jgi:DNA-binding GntR family transcriptional regulator